MARSVLASVVIDGARLKADDFTDSALATDAEMIVYADSAWTRLYALYLRAEPDRFRTEATITGVTGTTAYAVPADWFSTIAVDYQEAAGTFYELRRLHEHERNTFNGVTTGDRALAYRVIGTNVVLYPGPRTGQSYKHIYLPTATAITATSTSIDCRMGHEKFLINLVARELLLKEQQYSGEFEKDIDKFEEDITEEANMRYLHEPAMMAGLSGTVDYDPADYRRWP